MPVEYEAKDNDQRIIVLQSDLKSDPEVSIAALIHGVVKDLLHQHQYAYAHFDEFVDLAVVATGLGAIRSNLDLVASSPSFWDSTQWRFIPRPFLDSQGVAYTNAVAAWVRGDSNPEWADDLESELKRATQKSLKFLTKTNDSFLEGKFGEAKRLNQPQREWLKEAQSKSVSQQIVAVRHLEKDESVLPELQSTITEKLRSTHDAVMLNAISATEQIVDIGDTAIEELRFLTQHRDHIVRAKAMCALSRLEQLEESTIQKAGEMLGSKKKHEIFAGLMALSSLGSVSDHLIPPINRAFIRSLQVCDYEFLNLFAAAFTKWLKDPKGHVEQLLRDDSPEYMELAMEALDNVNEQFVGLG